MALLWSRKKKSVEVVDDTNTMSKNTHKPRLVRRFTAADFGINRKIPVSSTSGKPQTTAVDRILRNPTVAIGGTRERGVYQKPPWDFEEFYAAYETESIFRRAIDKYTELILKEGWELVGKDPNSQAVRYVQERFNQMEEVTGTSTHEFMETMVRQLLLFGNLYVAKARNLKASGGRVRKTITGRKLTPVAGYFVQDARFIEMDIKLSGQPASFRAAAFNTSTDCGRTEIVWSPENMIHGISGKVSGAWGMPLAVPVLEDMRALRELEEHTLMLVHTNAIPVYQYKVGTTEVPASEDELAEIEAIIDGLPASGAFVTPERHDVKVVGSDNKALDTCPYLKYFKDRVLSGLGMSDVGMGTTDTTNKSTAQVVSSETRQTAEFIQKSIKYIWDHYIIRELLAEGGFKVSAFNDKNDVELRFPSINKEERRANENHASQLWAQNLITETEARAELGRKALTPEQRKELYGELYDTSEGTEGANAQSNNKAQPANQHGKQATKPSIAKRDVYIPTPGVPVEQLLQDVKNRINHGVNTQDRHESAPFRQILDRIHTLITDRHYPENETYQRVFVQIEIADHLSDTLRAAA